LGIATDIGQRASNRVCPDRLHDPRPFICVTPSSRREYVSDRLIDILGAAWGLGARQQDYQDFTMQHIRQRL